MSDEETEKEEAEAGQKGDGEAAAEGHAEVGSEEIAPPEGEDAAAGGPQSDAGGGKRAIANSIFLARMGYRENMALLQLQAVHSYKAIVLAVGGALAFLVLAIAGVAFIVLSLLNSDTETTTLSDNNETQGPETLAVLPEDTIKKEFDIDGSAAAFAEEIVAAQEAAPKGPWNASGKEDSYLNVLDVA
ncbi:uncharacterized protein LOC144130250 [Amblyomma americanum]